MVRNFGWRAPIDDFRTLRIFRFLTKFSCFRRQKFRSVSKISKMSTILKMKARHMYDIKHHSIFVNLNYKYYKDTAVVKWRYTAHKIMCVKKKFFQWSKERKRVKGMLLKIAEDRTLPKISTRSQTTKNIRIYWQWDVILILWSNKLEY